MLQMSKNTCIRRVQHLKPKGMAQASQVPTVLHPIELATFIQHILYHVPAPVHLITCSSQEEFLRQLLASINHEKDLAIKEAEELGLDPRKLERLVKRSHDLLVPTLRQLASGENVKVAFCESLPQLQAYLSVCRLLSQVSTDQEGNTKSATLVLLNPVSLHRNVSSFSAQGLSRTFSNAVEAASHISARLLVAECPQRAPSQNLVGDSNSDEFTHENASDVRLEDDTERQDDPWDEEVSILNVTSKTFGPGQQAWVGKTVKIRRVAERWFLFKRLSN